MDKERCYLYGNCPCQTAVCTGMPLPDEGCPVYRYFRKLILMKPGDHEVCRNCLYQPIRPVWKDNKIYCGACGKRIPRKINAHYCHNCGRRILWNA